MRRWVPPVLAAILGLACETPDPKAELEITDIETYWAVDSPVGSEQYIAPVVRFMVRNKGTRAWRSVEASATFRQKGDSADWSTAFQVVPRRRGEPLEVGEAALVILKPDHEGRYHSPGMPESMFAHEKFRDVTARVFLRLGSAYPALFAEVEVERRIGSKSVLADTP